MLIVQYGRSFGVRDDNALESALASPLNVLRYSENHTGDRFDAAAAFAYGTGRSHPFVRGNVRASWLTTQIFLAGYGVETATGPADCVTCMVQHSDGRMPEKNLAALLRAQARADESALE